mgnify:CR=1 FL=1
MEYENTLEIIKDDNLYITFDECLEFLKTLGKNSTNRMDKFKEFLKCGIENIVIFKPDFPVYWKVE